MGDNNILAEIFISRDIEIRTNKKINILLHACSNIIVCIRNVTIRDEIL